VDITAPQPTLEAIAEAFPDHQVWDQQIHSAGFAVQRTVFLVPLGRSVEEAVATIFNWPDEGVGTVRIWETDLVKGLVIVDAFRALGFDCTVDIPLAGGRSVTVQFPNDLTHTEKLKITSFLAELIDP
jgi:hypothetical protein